MCRHACGGERLTDAHSLPAFGADGGKKLNNTKAVCNE